MSSPETILKKYWGFDQFRVPQREIIRSILEKKDTLALLPTGGGKSICYQVPGVILEGITLVVSPLIALMQDQVQQLRTRNIPALAVHSGMGRQEIDIALDNCVYGKYKFLYLSPERIQTEIFRERFMKMNVSLLAVDEAHCISQWGYDFRPPYMQIASLRDLKPDIPFLAVTATATTEVKDDIVTQLRMRNAVVFQKSFARDNLSFVVRKTENKEKKLLEVLSRVPGTAIVYVRSRKATVELSRWLERQKVSATFYHAGLSHAERMARQEGWIDNSKRVMVATNAFGMGIDKPDVRTVVHMDLPENLEAYYQEAGRAGRDGKHCYAALVYHEADVSGLRAKVKQSYPEIEFIKMIYQALANYFQLAVGGGDSESFDFDIDDFCRRFSLRSSLAFPALKKLDEQGLILLGEGFYRPSRVHIQVDKTRLYEFQVASSKFDPLIKTLLRLYGAELFSDFMNISEALVAKGMESGPADVVKSLEQLQNLQVIAYEPASDKPRITFLTPRQNAERLAIDRVHLESRRDLAFRKMESMIRFAEQTQRCRMQVVQEYFGELSDSDCGKCDVCIDRKKKDNSSGSRDYEEKVLKLLAHKPHSVEELESAVSPRDHDLFVEVVREMVDRGVIHYDEYWILRKVWLR